MNKAKSFLPHGVCLLERKAVTQGSRQVQWRQMILVYKKNYKERRWKMTRRPGHLVRGGRPKHRHRAET